MFCLVHVSRFVQNGHWAIDAQFSALLSEKQVVERAERVTTEFADISAVQATDYPGEGHPRQVRYAVR